jgi:hypothetical protein
MSPHGPRKRTRPTRAEIRARVAALDAALAEIVGAFAPVTVRQVFYQAVDRDLVPKDEASGYGLVQGRLAALRGSRDIPCGCIVDGTRHVHGHGRFKDLDEFAVAVAGLYRKDYWATSEVKVGVWLDKDSLKGVLESTVVNECGLGLHVARSFASITYLQGAARTSSSTGVLPTSTCSPTSIRRVSRLSRKWRTS